MESKWRRESVPKTAVSGDLNALYQFYYTSDDLAMIVCALYQLSVTVHCVLGGQFCKILKVKMVHSLNFYVILIWS